MEKQTKTNKTVSAAEKAATKPEYSYYSNILKKPFATIAELREAEGEYYAAIKAEEDKVAAKKADENKVAEAYKALNAARKLHKEKLEQLAEEYSEALVNLRKAFEAGKADVNKALEAAEENYAKVLKAFADKYESYELNLKDGENETTISGKKSGNVKGADFTNLLYWLLNR